MYEELKSLIKDIHDRTGIDFALYSGSGEPIAAVPEWNGVFDIDSVDFDNNICVDLKSGLTYFVVDLKGTVIYGAVSGTDENAVRYSNLISALVESNCKSVRGEPSRAEMLQSILLGNATRGDMRIYAEKLAFSSGFYYVYSVGTTASTDELLNFLNSLSNSKNDMAVLISENKIAYIKSVENIDEFITPYEFANMMVKNIYEELAMNVYVCYGAIAKGPEDFYECFNQANMGLEMGKRFNSNKNIFSYKEFILVNILDELPKHTKIMFRKKLLSSPITDVLTDADLKQTAEVFLNHSLNLSETARALYVHRNTLMYRLDKIERDTGLNIRNFADALTFRLLEILYELTEKF